MKLKIQILILLSLSCVSYPKKNSQIVQLRDLKKYSQNPSSYVKNIQSLEQQDIKDKEYNEKFFAPWKIDKVNLDFYNTVGFAHKNRNTYGFNKIPLQKSWYKAQVDNMNLSLINQVAKRAITIKNSHIRALPTDLFVFDKPSLAGEGFPFDYIQHSFIPINTPIFISHFSKNKNYVLIQSAITEGWVKSESIAFVDEEVINQFQNENYFIAVQEGFSIFNKDVFVEKIKLGTIFPKIESKLVIIQRNKGSYNGSISFVLTEEKNIMKKPIKFESENISMVANQLIGEEYGWGGVLNKRDCSAMTRDFFSVFGVFLNRNSSQQLKNGKTIDIMELSEQKKKKKIIQLAKPFKSLLYLKGHIVLYVGNVDGEPVVMHNIWGVKTLKKDGSYGRYNIGRAIISSLNLGDDLENHIKSKVLIKRIEKIVNL